MNSVRQILAYAPSEDEDLRAVKQAAWLARENGAAITVLRVLSGGARLKVWKPRVGSFGPEELRNLVENTQREELETQVAPFRGEGLDISVEIRWGNPWLEVTYSVLRDGYDLVIKAASGAGTKRRPFFGSVALHLIRKCPCPVLIVGEDSVGSDSRILAAIDPAEGDARAEHARAIMRWAMSLAGESGELHAASAWEAWGDTMLEKRVRSDELVEYVRSSEQQASSGLHGILASVENPLEPEHVHLLKGAAREMIPQFVERKEFDVVVMGSVGRVGVAGLLVGETAETVVRSVRASVFVVKPPGFVSPVQLPDDRA